MPKTVDLSNCINRQHPHTLVIIRSLRNNEWRGGGLDSPIHERCFEIREFKNDFRILMIFFSIFTKWRMEKIEFAFAWMGYYEILFPIFNPILLVKNFKLVLLI